MFSPLLFCLYADYYPVHTFLAISIGILGPPYYGIGASIQIGQEIRL